MTFNHFQIHIEPEHRGIDDAWPWRHAWTPRQDIKLIKACKIIILIIVIRDGELFIVLEDDTELSPHWYRALVNMWQRSGILVAISSNALILAKVAKVLIKR